MQGHTLTRGSLYLDLRLRVIAKSVVRGNYSIGCLTFIVVNDPAKNVSALHVTPSRPANQQYRVALIQALVRSLVIVEVDVLG